MMLIMVLVILYIHIILLIYRTLSQRHLSCMLFSLLLFYYLSLLGYNLSPPLQCKIYKGKNFVCIVYHRNFSTRMVPAHNTHSKNTCWINGQMCKVAFSCLRKLRLRDYFIQSYNIVGIQIHFIPMSLIFYSILISLYQLAFLILMYFQQD